MVYYMGWRLGSFYMCCRLWSQFFSQTRKNGCRFWKPLLEVSLASFCYKCIFELRLSLDSAPQKKKNFGHFWCWVNLSVGGEPELQTFGPHSTVVGLGAWDKQTAWYKLTFFFQKMVTKVYLLQGLMGNQCPE